LEEEIELVYSKQDIAGKNIQSKLINCKYKITEVDGSLLTYNPKEKNKIYIFLSKHKSKERVKALTCHHPANWTSFNDYGGEEYNCSYSAPSVIKGLAVEIKKRINKLEGYEFTLEVSHHGPTPEVPVIFVEIGSCEEDWNNQIAGEIIAESVMEFKPSKEGEIVMGVGGPHYAPNFTKWLSEYRIGHVIPKYTVDELTYESFVKGIEKSTEKVEKVLIDWKGLTKEQREKIIGFCKEYGIEYIKRK
jgi:D-aminoacyl-tRNA deacylase